MTLDILLVYRFVGSSFAAGFADSFEPKGSMQDWLVWSFQMVLWCSEIAVHEPLAVSGEGVCQACASSETYNLSAGRPSAADSTYFLAPLSPDCSAGWPLALLGTFWSFKIGDLSEMKCNVLVAPRTQFVQIRESSEVRRTSGDAVSG